MLTETIANLFIERDQVQQETAILVSKRKQAFSLERMLIDSQVKAAAENLASIDATLPVLLAAAGRWAEVTALFSDRVIVGEVANYVGMGYRGRFDTVLAALMPFPDLYFGNGRDGQVVVGLKPLENGDWAAVSRQMRHPDEKVWVGPEAQVKQLVALIHGLHPLDLPGGRALGHGTFLLRISGPADSPSYNPRDVANRLAEHVSVLSQNLIPDGFIRLRESDEVARAIAEPQVYTDQWWEHVQFPPADLDWKAALLDVTTWDAYKTREVG